MAEKSRLSPTWKIENEPNEFVDLTWEIFQQNIEVPISLFFLTTYNQSIAEMNLKRDYSDFKSTLEEIFADDNFLGS